MAIQIPNPGTGNGATGDNEFVLWSKVKDNFSNTSHAANRLVGKSAGQVPTIEGTNGVAGAGLAGDGFTFGATSNEELLQQLCEFGSCFYRASGASVPMNSANGAGIFSRNFSTYMGINAPYSPVGKDITFFAGDLGSSDNPDYTKYRMYKMYSNRNTTTDGNGYIKPSSPVLRVFNDRIEGNSDGDLMSATYTKNGVGDYTITGTTGLRTDGWYVVIPNDMNGNPKVAITLDDTDGVITLKTYVRIFDMSTFKFVPDLEQPLDIPDGRWIDLRFNDLPAEPMPPEV